MLNAPSLSTDHSKKQTRKCQNNSEKSLFFMHVFHALLLFPVFSRYWFPIGAKHIPHSWRKPILKQFGIVNFVNSCPLFHSLILPLSSPSSVFANFFVFDFVYFFLSLWYTFSHSTVNAFIECEEFRSNLHHTRSHYTILAHD